MFVLESLENLRKNGRLTKLQSVITGALKIKLFMGATPEGEICKLGQALTIKQALTKMVDRCRPLPGRRPDRPGERDKRWRERPHSDAWTTADPPGQRSRHPQTFSRRWTASSGYRFKASILSTKQQLDTDSQERRSSS